VHLATGETDGLPDLYAVARYPDDVNRMVYLDFDPETKVRWTSEPLGDGADYVNNASASDPTHIYLAYETTLATFDRADGRILWLAELSDRISNICRDCLQVFGERVVALSDDGHLQAFDTRNGQVAWKMRLETSPRWMQNLSGRVVVLDEGEDGVGINIYQPENGERLARIVPTCPNEIFPDIPQVLEIYSPVSVTSDGAHLLVPISRYEPGCIQTWDGTSLTQIDQVIVAGDILRGISQKSLFTPEAIYLNSDIQEHDVVRVNLADRSYTTLYDDPDYKFTLLDAQDGTLTVLAQRTRGTTRYELRGMNQGSGESPWTYEFTAGEPLESTVTAIDDDGNWYVAAGPGQILVLEAYADPAHATLTLLNPGDGTTLFSNSLQLDQGDSDYWLQVPGWTQERLFLVTGKQIRMVDTTTGEQVAVWP
jgi:outer membrane protein assembly factor BamB